MLHLINRIIPLLILGALAQCAYLDVRRNNQPTTDINVVPPQVWATASSAQNAKISTGWLREFDDSELIRVVQLALAHNQDLAATAEQLKAVQQNTIIGRANRLPDLSARLSNSQSSSGSGSYSLSFNSSWEPDLWRRLRDLDHLSQLDYTAAVADYRAARLSLASRTARAYINLISAQQQLDLAHANQKSFEQNLRIISNNYRAGIPGTRALDVQFGRNNVTSAKRTAEQRQLQMSDSARALQNLIGVYPSGQLSKGNQLPTLKRNVPTSIPATMIERRPDLTAARIELYASAIDTDVARKNLLPSANLSGILSNSDSRLSRIFDPTQLAASIAGKAAYFRNQAEVKRYVADCLDAFREVESAIETDDSLRKQETLLKREVSQANLAEKQAERDYSEGIENADILSVLEAQRRATNARAALITLHRNRLLNRVDLHTTLGGDYLTEEK